MTQGIIELYLQGMKPEEVKQTIDQELEKLHPPFSACGWFTVLTTAPISAI